MAWPTAVAGDSDLFVAVNNLNTTLNGAIDNVVTSIVLTDASSFPSTGGYATIGTEAIKYTGKSVNTLTGCTRGADGTTASSHSNGAPVFMFMVADHHNVLKDEVIAIENSLNLTASRLMVTSGSGRASVSSVTSTEAGYLSGVTSAIQTQINSKAPTASPTFTGQVTIPAGTAAAPAIVTPSGNGIYDSGSGGLQISGSGSQRVRFDSTFLVFTNTQFSGIVEFTTGTAAAPSIRCSSDANTGLFWGAADDLYVTTGGSIAATFAANTTINKGQLLAQGGSAALPAISFAADTDTGFYRTASNLIEIASGGVKIGELNQSFWDVGQSTGSVSIRHRADTTTAIQFTGSQVIISAGGFEALRAVTVGGAGASALTKNGASPVLVFVGDVDTGIGSSGADSISLFTGGVQRVSANSSGNVGVGTSSQHSTLHVGGSVAAVLTSITANTTLNGAHCFIKADATSGAITVTLPTAVGIAGRIYYIKKVDSSVNTVTIDGNASETIDGALTVTLSAQWENKTIVSDGANWLIY